MPKGVEFIEDDDPVIPDTPSPVFKKTITTKNENAKTKCRLILPEDDSGSDSDFRIAKPAPKRKRYNGSSPPVKCSAKQKDVPGKKNALKLKQDEDIGESSRSRTNHKKNMLNFFVSSSDEESESEDELSHRNRSPVWAAKHRQNQEKRNGFKIKAKGAVDEDRGGSSKGKMPKKKNYLTFFDAYSSESEADHLPVEEPAKPITQLKDCKENKNKSLKLKHESAVRDDSIEFDDDKRSHKNNVTSSNPVSCEDDSQSKEDLILPKKLPEQKVNLKTSHKNTKLKEKGRFNEDPGPSNSNKQLKKKKPFFFDSSSEKDLQSEDDLFLMDSDEQAAHTSNYAPQTSKSVKRTCLQLAAPEQLEAGSLPDQAAQSSHAVSYVTTSAGQASRTSRSKRPLQNPSQNDVAVITLSSDEELDNPLQSSPDMDDDEFDWLIERLGGGGSAFGAGQIPGPTMCTENLNTALPTWSNSPTRSGPSRQRRGPTTTATRSNPRVNDFVTAGDLMGFSTPQEACSCHVAGRSRSSRRRSCSCKDICSGVRPGSGVTAGPEVRPGSSRSNKKKPKRKTPSASASRGAASGADDSMVRAVRAVNQMETDEEMARKLQEDLDHQFAAALASGASSTPQATGAPPRQQMPGTVHQADDIELRISLMTDWEWAVHVALVRGQDIPSAPGNEFHRSPDEALDPSLLEYLHAHPEVMNRRYITNSRNGAQRNQRAAPPLPTLMSPDSPPVTGRRRARLPRAAATDHRRRRSTNRALQLNELEHRLLGLLEMGPLVHQFNRRGGFRGGMDAPDGNDYEDLLALEDQLGAVAAKPGLSAEQISRLPVTTYTADPPSTSDKECHVCMSDYEQGERLRILTCFHTFHTTCIDQWIKNKPTCPVCRTEVEV